MKRRTKLAYTGHVILLIGMLATVVDFVNRPLVWYAMAAGLYAIALVGWVTTEHQEQHTRS